nr:hypothetical protein [uncultured Nocardioides sp.]
MTNPTEGTQRYTTSRDLTRRRADLVFGRARVAVYLDGCFWHVCPAHGNWPRANAAWWRAKLERNVARDRETDKRLEAEGWLSLRIWEHEDPAGAASRIQTIVRSRTSQS